MRSNGTLEKANAALYRRSELTFYRRVCEAKMPNFIEKSAKVDLTELYLF